MFHWESMLVRNNITTGRRKFIAERISGILRGLKFKPDKEIGQEVIFYRNLKFSVGIFFRKYHDARIKCR